MYPHSQCEQGKSVALPWVHHAGHPLVLGCVARARTHTHTHTHTLTHALGSCSFTPLHTEAADPASCAALRPSSRNSPFNLRSPNYSPLLKIHLEDFTARWCPAPLALRVSRWPSDGGADPSAAESAHPAPRAPGPQDAGTQAPSRAAALRPFLGPERGRLPEDTADRDK